MPQTEGFLDGRKDLTDYAAWLYEQTNDWKNVNASEFREELTDDEIDEALDEARRLMQELMNEFEAQGSPNDVHSVLPPSDTGEPYQRFLQCVKEEKQQQYSWQMWVNSDTDLTVWESEVNELGLDVEMIGKPVGYSDHLVRSCLLKNTALIQHTYEAIPDDVHLKLTPVSQGVHRKEIVYMGATEVAKLDAISKVPWIPPSLQSHQFAAKAKNGSLSSDDQWQRLVSKARLKDIRNFARGSDNFMFNPVLLYVNKNHESVHFNAEDSSINIDFNFLKHKNGYYYDYISWPNEEDNRPVWIVDGQHRVRGFGGATRGSMLMMPFVLMIGDGSQQDRELVARIFTEINTNAKSLDQMHQLYLKWQFRIPSDSPRNDFSTVGESPTDKSRPNRMAYQLALEMAGNSASPLYNSIQFQEPDKSSAPRARMKKHLIVKSTNWMQIARKWFANNGIYSDSETDQFSFDEVMNFFIAFEQTCNHEGWDDGKNRWRNAQERKIKRSIIQQQGPFRALMHLVTVCVERLQIRYGSQRETAFSIEQFMNILAPLKNIDWNLDTTEQNGLNALKGRGNLNVPHLKMWMERAIENGQIHSWEDIHNPEEKSIPGKGLNAAPSNDGLSIQSEGDSPDWPGTMPVIVSLPRPEHALRCSWNVTQSINGKQETIDIKKAWFTVDQQKTELVLERDAISSDAEAIRITGMWRNGIGEALANDPWVRFAP